PGNRDLAPLSFAAHHGFEAQAGHSPLAAAIIQGSTSITYDDLNRRANRVARELARRGVGAGSRVGLLATMSIDLVTGFIGILKCGCAYVPLDPHDPSDRITFVIRDADAIVILAAGGAGDRLQVEGRKVLDLGGVSA